MVNGWLFLCPGVFWRVLPWGNLTALMSCCIHSCHHLPVFFGIFLTISGIRPVSAVTTWYGSFLLLDNWVKAIIELVTRPEHATFQIWIDLGLCHSMSQRTYVESRIWMRLQIDIQLLCCKQELLQSLKFQTCDMSHPSSRDDQILKYHDIHILYIHWHIHVLYIYIHTLCVCVCVFLCWFLVPDFSRLVQLLVVSVSPEVIAFNAALGAMAGPTW